MHDRAESRVLSLRPVVWLGLISYPLYLWHWTPLSLTVVVWGEGASLNQLRLYKVFALFEPARQKAGNGDASEPLFEQGGCGQSSGLTALRVWRAPQGRPGAWGVPA